MKKIAILVMGLVAAISLYGCACNNEAPATTPSTRPTTAPTTAPTTRPTMPTETVTLPVPETNIPDPSVDTSMTDGSEAGTGQDQVGKARGRMMR